jgi:hypothetical protein
MPLHEDNATVIHERIRLDRSDPGLLGVEATIIDHALTPALEGHPCVLPRAGEHGPNGDLPIFPGAKGSKTPASTWTFALPSPEQAGVEARPGTIKLMATFTDVI